MKGLMKKELLMLKRATRAFAFICVIFYVRRNFVLIGTNPIAQILFHCIVQIDGEFYYQIYNNSFT